ncbi:AAA family ATPase [Neomegalonema perideroedes]|uniref:AAA family ATPase n=1 Tax=Neomegalonema perideroedes TaxID=217219 RepID=UPI00037B03E0|nr:AAA family ATPase [Neomegalonema perideroedes]
MFTHEDLSRLQSQSLKLQGWIRQQTFSPQMVKTLRRFSSWELGELILKANPSTLRGRMMADPSLPAGLVEEEGRQRWYSLEEINELRRRLRIGKKTLMPPRPAGKRALRAAVANFKGGAGKSTVALHFAHAAALDGYRVLAVDFDPQATLSHAMGLTEVSEEHTVWGVMARDLIRETERLNAVPTGAESGAALPKRRLPSSLMDLGLGELRTQDFIRPTCWPTIDMIPSCANSAFVEFASAQYRHLNPEWSFYAAVSRYLDSLAPDAYDLVIFDCPPAIGYQSMNAVFAADMLYIPSGPGYWEYDSTTSFIGQLAEALGDLAAAPVVPAGTPPVKEFLDVRFLLTRFEANNDLHRAMDAAFRKVFGERVAENQIEMTRAVEQSGRFLSSIYEIDYRSMTRETWRRARASFDRAYEEFRGYALAAWEKLEESP